MADAFTDKLVSRIGALTVGDPLQSDTQIGPLISEEAAERVAGEVSAAKDAGVSLLTGGGRLRENGTSKGHFVAPALFAGVTSGLAPGPGRAVRAGAGRDPGR